MRMDQWCVGAGGLSRLRTLVTPTEIDIITRRVEPKADSHLQVDPSVCVIDAKSAFDHLVRESTGGHCRRTAHELCVIKRNMQTLRASCSWVPHERMVVDEVAWEQRYDVATVARWSPVNHGRRSRAGDEKSVP